MTRSVIIFRHGKSDWVADHSHDRERPLSRRGAQAARAMGRLLAASGMVPQRALCSPALRVATTVDLAIIAGDWVCERETCEGLYLGGAEAMLDELRGLPDTLEHVLLAGHETSCSETVGRLVGGGDVRIPTAAMACVEFGVEHWRHLSWGDGQLVWLVPPRLLLGGPEPWGNGGS
jgi:phosphohistidine phosphatase